MQAYIDPTQIAIIEVVNHRETNQNYIEALADSMRNVGFSAEYPVDVFRSENIPNHDLDPEATPYVVACGVHRTFAAQKAEIEKIFATIHDGGEEAWVEMMHSDNFQFDPATNRDIGQPFTPKERRAACSQLLLLPKYLEQTNTALSEAWNTSESNIRRWKEEIAGLIETNSPMLRLWGISDGRVERLKTILASNARVNEKGEVVQIRKPRTDASDDEKDIFFDKINEDFRMLRDDPESNIIFNWDTVKEYCGKKCNIQVGWSMCKDMHIDQLRKLHKMVITQNPDFVFACTEIFEEAQRTSKLRDTLEKTCEKTLRVFCKLIDADDKYAGQFSPKWETFEGIVKSQLNIEIFGHSIWEYNEYFDTDTTTADECRTAIAHHKTVQAAIAKGADWIAEFMKKEASNAAKRRKKVSKGWTEKRQMAIDAINAYPRDISFDRLISEAEKKLYKTHGYFNKIFDAEGVSDRKNIGTLEDEVKSLDRLINAVKNDVDWVSEIPVSNKLMEAFTEAAEPNEPEFTLTADDLHGISLEEIFQHVADRVIHVDGIFDENEVMMEMARILGKATRGQVGTQLYLLMKFALFIQPKRDIEGVEIEKASPFGEGEAAD